MQTHGLRYNWTREEVRTIYKSRLLNLLSHQVAEKLASIEPVEFIEDRNTIRLAVVDILTKWLKKEETIDQAARHKIENQKRTIMEGSQEWDILYRKYYNEEVKKLGL